MTSAPDRCMVQTRAQAMANEKIVTVEQKLEALTKQIQTLTDTITKGKLGEQSEAYAFHENLKGESSHSLHFYGNC